MKKYKLGKKEENGLRRIIALKDFGYIKKGSTGGYIESYSNLSQEGNAWVSGDAQVYDNARVYDDAQVSGDARVYDDAQVSDNAWVSDNAQVYGNAWVYGEARVYGDAWVSGDAQVYGNAGVSGDAQVYGNAWVYGEARVYGDAQVSSNARVSGEARVSGDAQVSSNAQVSGNAWVSSDARVYGNAWVYGDAWVYGNAQVYDNARVYGNAWVSGNAQVYGDARVLSGHIKFNYKSIRYELAKQLGITTSADYVTLFKKVNKTNNPKVFTSLYKSNFKYEIDKTAKAVNPEISNKSCASGLHCSTALYWEEGDTLLEVQVKLEDIITVQEGKVRCKALKVIGVVNFDN